MINEKLENLLNWNNENQVIAGGIFSNSKLTLYANVNSTRRMGIFKYIITPHSFSEKRISPFCLDLYGPNDSGARHPEKEYVFFFNHSHQDFEVFEVDSIEELCDNIETVSSCYEDMVICMSKFCPDVPLKITQNVVSKNAE